MPDTVVAFKLTYRQRLQGDAEQTQSQRDAVNAAFTEIEALRAQYDFFNLKGGFWVLPTRRIQHTTGKAGEYWVVSLAVEGRYRALNTQVLNEARARAETAREHIKSILARLP